MGEGLKFLPDIELFQRQAEGGNLVPVFVELPADLETPVSVFLKLRGAVPGFLLESVERGEQVGRYSFIGVNPFMTFQALGGKVRVDRGGEVTTLTTGLSRGTPDPLRNLQELLSRWKAAPVEGLPRFFGGAVGYLGYDMVRFFEKLPTAPRDELNLPDCSFLFTDTLVVFDHVQQKMQVVGNAFPQGNAITAYREAQDKIRETISSLKKQVPEGSLSYGADFKGPTDKEMASNFTRRGYEQAVVAAKEYIMSGDVFQVVLSHRLRHRTVARPFEVYRVLRMLNPSPYMFFLDLGGFQLIGSSPEMLVKLEGRQAETRPIAGTRPRGRGEEEEKAIALDLLSDYKERAEHLMLVDLGRNDLGRVVRYGGVKVPSFMEVEKYSHVMHLVSSVKGELSEGQDAFSLLRACFPAGTVTGAPKVRAMEIINELEGLRRGPYAGAVGYFSFTGNMDTCITIRTILMVGDMAYLQGGAGIVADSQPALEYEETMRKLEVLRRALFLAETRVEEGVGR